jgi:hypothetical protein
MFAEFYSCWPEMRGVVIIGARAFSGREDDRQRERERERVARFGAMDPGKHSPTLACSDLQVRRLQES